MKKNFSALTSLDLRSLISRKDDLISIIRIDFPKTGERIQPRHYAICICACGGDDVQVSIDRGDWRQCHSAKGFFWYDWHNIPNGKHKIVARMKLPTGKFKKSKDVKVIV